MSNYQPPANALAKGSQLYKSRLNPGRKRQFDTPDVLWQAARKYFSYCKDHPVPYHKACRGKLIIIYKYRPMSIKALCAYLHTANLDHYKKQPAFTEVLGRIRDVIYVHNYTAAVVDLLGSQGQGQK